MELPKPEGHPPDSAAKPDVNLSIHPAPQQCSGCHPYNNEQGHDNDDAVNSNCPDGSYLGFYRGGEPPIGRQDRKASHNRNIAKIGAATVEQLLV